MARIVQDSDEELDDDLERDLVPPKQLDASAQPPSNETHGTGSTESLKRAIEKAHREHLQSQPSQDEPQSSVSLPEHPNKKRKATADPSPLRPSSDASSKKRGPITYGKPPRSIFGSSPAINAPLDDPSGTNIAPHYDTGWLPDATMREFYINHEPAMFAEPSSTIPNATMTQQHVLEAVNAPMMGLESETGGHHWAPPPEPSIPWSELMKFTPTGASDQIDSSNRDLLPPDLPSATPVRTTQEGYEYSASQRSRRGSSVRLKNSPLRNELPHTEANPAATLGLPSTASPGTQSSSHGEAKKTPRRSKSQLVSIDRSDDDLSAIGLPKEQYKPRPSRSRSLKVEEEQPIDYSVRPEKAKKVSRRRQTTAAVDASNVKTPEKVRQICDMGFTPTTTSGALKRNNGDVIQTIEWLVTNNVGHDELAPPSPPKSKAATNKSEEKPAMDSEAIQDIMRDLNEYRRDDTQAAAQDTVHVVVANDTTVQPEIADAVARLPVTEMRSPTKVQVVIPKRSPVATSKQPPSPATTSNKKAKRRKTTLDQPESDSIAVDAAVPEAAPVKKARGRPKKTAPAVLPKEPDPEPPEQTTEVEQHEFVQTTEPEALPEIAQQSAGAASKEKKQSTSADIADTTTANDPMPPSKPSPAAASATPEPKTKPATASPATTGKVPYRVGLSKRARIAPLLRIVKK
ncbi:hypothetical protein ACET3X_009538 [Alternaria dauci]|uniref:UBA domain-containing protein n=1 Tax=Alternaria dauci TaxID=48095 RepID=A0ABR3U6M7_9PLEO